MFEPAHGRVAPAGGNQKATAVDNSRSPAIEPSDEDLAARIAQRDRAAFNLIYDRYVRSIYALALHALSAADAEEIVQEVFLRLWNKAHQFDTAQGSFAAWFMTIARHRVLDELRHRGDQQRWMAAEEIGELMAEAADPNSDVEEQVWLRQRGDAVLNALESLPEEQRRIIILAYFGGFSQTEMAALLGVPLGTVKKRVRLGLQKLKAALGGEEHPVETPAGSNSVSKEY